MKLELNPRLLQGEADALVAPPRERANIGACVHHRRPELMRECSELALRNAVAEEQAAPALAQRAVQIAQAFEHELGPGTRAMAAFDQSAVHAEHGHHAVAARERRVKCRMVLEPQVAAQP